MIQYPLSSIGNAVNDFANLWHAYDDNEYLSKQLAEQKNYQTAYEDERNKNKQLEGLLEMKGGFGDAKTISVSVLERSSDSWLQTVTISAGKKQGVEKNMLVATSDGAIGLVESVQTMTSTVQLLTSQHLSNDIAIKMSLEEVAVYNLYEMRPEDAFNVDSWSKIISQASAIVFQFPLYWMSAPSLLKKWQDEVFTYLAKTPAVAGKALLVAVTTGSEYSAYRSGGRNNFTIDELLRPYQGSAIHAGMVWQTPVVAYGMGTADAGKNIAEGVNNYKVRIESLVGKNHVGNDW